SENIESQALFWPICGKRSEGLLYMSAAPGRIGTGLSITGASADNENNRRVAQTRLFSACLRFPEGTAPRFPSVIRPVLEAGRLDSPFSSVIAGVIKRFCATPETPWSAAACCRFYSGQLAGRAPAPVSTRFYPACEQARRAKAAASCRTPEPARAGGALAPTRLEKILDK